MILSKDGVVFLEEDDLISIFDQQIGLVKELLNRPELLNSAIESVKMKVHYEDSLSIFDIAAEYIYKLAKNHAFTDGNKRIAFYTGILFIDLNHEYEMPNDDDEVLAIAIENVAAGKVDVDGLSKILSDHWHSQFEVPGTF